MASPVSQGIEQPSVWGLTAKELHDARWSGHGVQCVRIGDAARSRPLDRAADLYLLLEADQCAIFDLACMIERIVWHGAKVTRIRLLEPQRRTYDERIVCDERGLVQRIERRYGTPHGEQADARRAFITDRPAIAKRWQQATTAREGWTDIRRSLGTRSIRNGRIDRIRVPGQSFKLRSSQDERALLDALVRSWRDPSRVIEGIEEISSGVWQLRRDIDRTRQLPLPAAAIGPAWIGCGAAQAERRCIIGPLWLADELEALEAAVAVEGRAPATVRSIPEIELDAAPNETQRARPLGRRPEGVYPVVKRTMDIVVSAAAILAASPVLIGIGLAIYLSDGRPILFRHQRQTLGGRIFNCLKFRTMHRNADRMIAGDELKSMNVCDGAQVYIPDDPRVTRIGGFLRKTHLDELPQLLNVLVGDMSLVGPRPSPDKENRYCPAWRELRLSVRPGMTGLWQLKRTRSPGRDFQEWIRFDIEYVRNAGFALDLRILLETVKIVVLGRPETKEEKHETT